MNNIDCQESGTTAPVIHDVMELLYRAELNCSVFSKWDLGWVIRLGDDINGYKAVRNFEDLQDGAKWLVEAARYYYPKDMARVDG